MFTNREEAGRRLAVPVASREAIQSLREEGADEVVVIEPPKDFLGAVGAHYLAFEQMKDEDVIHVLHL